MKRKKKIKKPYPKMDFIPTYTIWTSAENIKLFEKCLAEAFQKSLSK